MIGASTKLFAQLGPCQHHCSIHCLQNCQRAKIKTVTSVHIEHKVPVRPPSWPVVQVLDDVVCVLLAPLPRTKKNLYELLESLESSLSSWSIWHHCRFLFFGILLLKPPSVTPRDRNQCTPLWRGWTCLGTNERGVDVLLYCAPIFLLPFLELCPMSLAAPRSLCTFCQGQNQIINSKACYWH